MNKDIKANVIIVNLLKEWFAISIKIPSIIWIEIFMKKKKDELKMGFFLFFLFVDVLSCQNIAKHVDNLEQWQTNRKML